MSDDAMPLFTWIHLSDLHVGQPAGEHSEWDRKQVFDGIIDDAMRLPGDLELPRPSMLLVSGDVAYSGTQEQYETAAKWLDELRERVGIERERVFFVAGNHDVQREVVQASNKNRELLDKSRASGANLKTLAPLTRERFKNYLDFVKRYNSACADPYGWVFEFTLPRNEAGGMLSRTNKMEGLRVRLVGLNTALLSQDGKDHGNLCIAEQGWNRMTESDAITLLMTHHPPDWLSEAQKRIFEGKRRFIHFHLCGHIHEAAGTSDKRAWDSNSLVTMVSGAAHGDRPRRVKIDGYELDVQAGHGFTFGVFARVHNKALLRVWPRVWADRQHRFVADTAVLERNRSHYEMSVELKDEALKKLPGHVAPAKPLSLFDGWETVVPSRVFPANFAGFSRALLQHQDSLMLKSTLYRYKGDTALVTSVQLEQWLRNESLDKVELLLAMPLQEVMRRRCAAEGADASDGRPERMVRDVLATICGLDAIRMQLQPSREIVVGFFSEEPYERIELASDGLYLTYYGLGGRYGTTLFYSNRSLVHTAMRKAFDVSMSSSEVSLRLSQNEVEVKSRRKGQSMKSLDDFFRVFSDGKISRDQLNDDWESRKKKVGGRL